nr:rna polymerase ii-associated protein rba50 [Quercus suber]
MIPGQRVEIDLGSDDEDPVPAPPVTLPGAFVGDVLERQPQTPRAPSAPTLRSKTGFPEHRKRNVESRFKRQKAVDASRDRSAPAGPLDDVADAAGSPPHHSTVKLGGDPESWEQEERRRIDEENTQKIAAMSLAEIEEERQELMDSLSPAFLQRLLRRSDINSGSTEADLDAPPPPPPEAPRNPAPEPKPKTQKSVSFADQPPSATVTDPTEESDDDETQPLPPSQNTTTQTLPRHDSIHFPQPQQPPDLDPASATFFADLHTKYFPALPAEPDKLAWMMQTPATPSTDAYHPSATAVHPQDLRFDFAGQLLAPKTAAQLPVTLGLHHHAAAPDAAGYTLPELARLARSVYPAQRCLAFQTLGRVLYRLGKGEFGDSGEPVPRERGPDEEPEDDDEDDQETKSVAGVKWARDAYLIARRIASGVLRRCIQYLGRSPGKKKCKLNF